MMIWRRHDDLGCPGGAQAGGDRWSFDGEEPKQPPAAAAAEEEEVGEVREGKPTVHALSGHVDVCEVSINICLGDEFEGGEVLFGPPPDRGLSAAPRSNTHPQCSDEVSQRFHGVVVTTMVRVCLTRDGHRHTRDLGPRSLHLSPRCAFSL